MCRPRKNIILTIIVLYFVSFSVYPHKAESASNDDIRYDHQESELSYFQKAKNWWNKHKPGREGELTELKSELKAKEEFLAIIETRMADIVNNARPKCANRTVSVSFSDDPRIELREEIKILKKKIADLEE